MRSPAISVKISRDGKYEHKHQQYRPLFSELTKHIIEIDFQSFLHHATSFLYAFIQTREPIVLSSPTSG